MVASNVECERWRSPGRGERVSIVEILGSAAPCATLGSAVLCIFDVGVNRERSDVSRRYTRHFCTIMMGEDDFVFKPVAAQPCLK